MQLVKLRKVHDKVKANEQYTNIQVNVSIVKRRVKGVEVFYSPTSTAVATTGVEVSASDVSAHLFLMW
jgi:NADH:ubiquinone oxidoreductase subunit D